MKSILAVPTVGVLVGTLAGVLAGPLAGIGTFAGAAAATSIAVALWKNQRDRGALERKLVPVPVRRVAGDDASTRRCR